MDDLSGEQFAAAVNQRPGILPVELLNQPIQQHAILLPALDMISIWRIAPAISG